jgi:tRNA threonylcarbamoyladenosine biosynthesis protein TsaE
MLETKTNSPQQTKELGRLLGELAKPGDVFCLYGDLGSGKTHLSQGIAEGLGVKEHVTSPTFTLINEYEGKYPLYHMDVYRLGGPEDMEDLGYEEYFYGDGVTLVEWADIVVDVLPGERLDIQFENLGESDRLLRLKGKGQRYNSLIEELLKSVRIGD